MSVPAMTVNIALSQLNTHLGDLQANLDHHLTIAAEARQNNADLLVFPELSLTGYSLQDLVPQIAIQPSKDNPIFKQLLQVSLGIDLVIGFVEEDSRHRFYISSGYLSQGEILHIHRKVYLPTYGIFDEKRFLAAGNSFRAFDTRFGRVGLLICEDFWHISSPYLLWQDGADIFLLTSASPGRGITEEHIGSADWVETINRSYAGLFTSFFAHSNRVGFEDGLYFWGGATLYDPDGKLVKMGPYDKEAITYAEMDLSKLRRTRTRLPLLRDERPDIVMKELGRILKNG
jgi:NAD+ synthase (glutamine-hydrolysing)